MKKIFLIMIGLSVSLLADFTRNNSTQIVTDSTTTLQWQDDVTVSNKTWTEAIAYCEGLTLGTYSDWRLPNLKELTSLVDDTQTNPAIDHSATAFQHTASSHYWSSTTYANTSYYNAWIVYFNNGHQSHYATKANSFYVRCVRAGQ